MKWYFQITLALITFSANSQSWQPFYPEETAFYITEGDYLATRHDVGVGIPSGAILGFDLIDSTVFQGGVYYRNTSIVNSGYEGECHDLVEWNGSLINTGQDWISLTQAGDTLYWPNTYQDTNHFMRLTVDSTIALVFNEQSLSSQTIIEDSVRNYTTVVLVNDSAVLNDTLSGHTISIAKELGLVRSPLPFCFPNQLIFIDQIAKGRNGSLSGFGMSGVYNYEIGTELHYKTTHTDALIGGSRPPYTEIIEREAFEVLTAEVNANTDLVSYSLKREYARKELTYTSNALGEYTVTSIDTFYVDTLAWNNSNLEDFFLTEMPRELDTTMGTENIDAAISFERFPTGNHNLSKTTRYPIFDTCGVTYPDFPLTGSPSKTTVLLQPFGLRSQLSVVFDGSDYNEARKELVYFSSFESTFGSPLPALGVTEISPVTVTIYPNPIQDWLRIEAEEGILDVQLWNIQGQLVFEKSAKSEPTILLHTNHLNGGIYMLTVRTKKGVSQQKIIKS